MVHRLRLEKEATEITFQYFHEGRLEQSLDHLLGFYRWAYPEQAVLTDRVIEIHAHRGATEYERTFQDSLRELTTSIRAQARQYNLDCSEIGIYQVLAALYESCAVHNVESTSDDPQASLRCLRRSFTYYSLSLGLGHQKDAALVAKCNLKQRLVAAELFCEAEELKAQQKYGPYLEKLATALFGLVCPQKEWEQYIFYKLEETRIQAGKNQATPDIIKNISTEGTIMRVTMQVDYLVFLREVLTGGKEFRKQQLAVKYENKLQSKRKALGIAQNAVPLIANLKEGIQGCQEEIRELLPDTYQRRRYFQLQEELRAVNISITEKKEKGRDCREELEEMQGLATHINEIVSRRSEKKHRRLGFLYDEILKQREQLEEAEEKTALIPSLDQEVAAILCELEILQADKAFERDAGKDHYRRLVSKKRGRFAHTLRRALQAGDEGDFSEAFVLLMKVAAYSPEVERFALENLISLDPRIAASPKKEHQELHRRIQDIYIPLLSK